MLVHFAFSSARDVGKLAASGDQIFLTLSVKTIFKTLKPPILFFYCDPFVFMQEHCNRESSMLIYPET